MHQKFVDYGTNLGIAKGQMNNLAAKVDKDPAPFRKLVKNMSTDRPALIEYIGGVGISEEQAIKLCGEPGSLSAVVESTWGTEHAGGAGAL